VTRHFAYLAIGLLAAAGMAGAASLKPANDRKAAPDFAFKDADGKMVRLSDLKGKVVLLDFWATWCTPCKVEIPWFNEFHKKNAETDFAVVGISMDDKGWEVVKPFLAKMAIGYRVVIGDDKTADVYAKTDPKLSPGLDQLPTTFLIDREGRIAAAHEGLTGKNHFEEGIKQLLAEPAPGK